jgi:small subunit ribosomal protein S4
MGDPRKLRNKIERPKRLWDADRISHDKMLRMEYGLKNSSEVWNAAAELKKYRREARRLLALGGEERERDENKILTKLARLGIMTGGKIEDVLSLEVKDVLERRLQTRVTRKGLARTMKQARQLITHGFISVGGKRVTVPSYLVGVEEEKSIIYTKPIDLSAGMSKEGEEKPEEKPAEEETKKEEVKPEEKSASEAKPAES